MQGLGVEGFVSLGKVRVGFWRLGYSAFGDLGQGCRISEFMHMVCEHSRNVRGLEDSLCL